MKQAMDYLARQQTTEAFKLFRLWQRMFKMTSFDREFVDAAKQALDRNSEDAEALYVLACLDRTKSTEETRQMAKRCVELDSSVPDFHHLLACLLALLNDINNALRAIDRASELLPNEPDWLFDRASILKRKEINEKKFSVDVAEAYLKFISSNPTDHRHYPEACYCLAHIYLLSHEVSKGKLYFQKGLDAENPSIRLPCFEPIAVDHPGKAIIRMLLKDLEKVGDPAAAASKETANNCANCFKNNQSFRCTACKSVWYCDRACQVAHWKKHKLDCNRLNRL